MLEQVEGSCCQATQRKDLVRTAEFKDLNLSSVVSAFASNRLSSKGSDVMDNCVCWTKLTKNVMFIFSVFFLTVFPQTMEFLRHLAASQ